MSAKYNKNLCALINASALCECAVPVFICDDNLRVCLVSRGARCDFKLITVGKDLSGFFLTSDIQKIKMLEGEAMLAEFSRTGKSASAVITSGNVEGERYVAVIIEPQFSFSEMPAPWYVGETFDAIRASLHELLVSPKSSVRHLEWYCATMSHICAFTDNFVKQGLYTVSSSSDIYAELDIVMEQSAAALESIGVATHYSKCVEVPFLTNTSPHDLYLITTLVLTTLALISDDGAVKVACRATEGEDAFMEISLAIGYTSPPIDNIDTFLANIPYLRLELAAAIDMAAHLKIGLSCVSDGEVLTFVLRIPADATGSVRFRAAELIPADKVRERLLSLYEHAKDMP